MRIQLRAEDGSREVVGRLQWFGRVIGNHHLGVGEPRPVDILKGANMSYRRAAIEGVRFDERLLGEGAQVHNDMAFSLSVRRKGWKLIYDPAVALDHFPAARFDADERDRFSGLALRDAVHNETLILLEHLSFLRRMAFLLWASLIGTRTAPGLLQTIRLALGRDRNVFCRAASTFAGRVAGLKTYRNQKCRR